MFLAKALHNINFKFDLFQHFSTNWHITRITEELQRRSKAHSIALLTLPKQGVYVYHSMLCFNPRTDGGRISALRRFFVDNGKTAARGAAKFGMTIPLSFLHIMFKL